jgi:hypothetical protein
MYCSLAPAYTSIYCLILLPYFLKYYPRALIGNFGVRGKESIAFGELENIE